MCLLFGAQTKFAVPDKWSLLGSTVSHTGNRGWSLTRAGNLDHFLQFCFLCISQHPKLLSWHISKAQPYLILSVSVYKLVIHQFDYSLLEPPDTVFPQLIFKFYYPRCYYFLCMLVVLICLKFSFYANKVSLSLLFCHERSRSKRQLLLKLSINHRTSKGEEEERKK